MSMEDLRKAIGFTESTIQLGDFNQGFFEAMAMMWSGALGKELTANDVVTLLAAPFSCGILKNYSVKMDMETTGIRIEVDAQEARVN